MPALTPQHAATAQPILTVLQVEAQFWHRLHLAAYSAAVAVVCVYILTLPVVWYDFYFYWSVLTTVTALCVLDIIAAIREASLLRRHSMTLTQQEQFSGPLAKHAWHRAPKKRVVLLLVVGAALLFSRGWATDIMHKYLPNLSK